jgi:hypothetical protein
MKNKNLKNLFVLLFPVCIYHASYAAVDTSNETKFYPEIKNYRLEYETDNIELDVYGADSNGKHNYSVYFSSSSSSEKLGLNLLNQDRRACDAVGDTDSGSILPDSTKGRSKTSWRLARTLKEAQQPKFFEIVDESGNKVFDHIAMPEIKADLSKDNKNLIITNDSSSAIKISSVIRKGVGNSGKNEISDGGVEIGAGSSYTITLNLPNICKAERSSKGAYRFDIAYEVGNETKRAAFVVEYSCNWIKEQNRRQKDAASEIEIMVDDSALKYDAQNGKYKLTIKNTSNKYIDLNNIALSEESLPLDEKLTSIAPGATSDILFPLSVPSEYEKDKINKYAKHVFISYYSHSVDEGAKIKTTTSKTIMIPVVVKVESLDKLSVVAGNPVSTFSYVLPQQNSESPQLTYKEIWVNAPKVDSSSSVYYEIINHGSSTVPLLINDPLQPIRRVSTKNDCENNLSAGSSCNIKLNIYPNDSHSKDRVSTSEDLSITPINLEDATDQTSDIRDNEFFQIVPLGQKVEYQFDFTANSDVGLYDVSIKDVAGNGIKASVKDALFIKGGCIDNSKSYKSWWLETEYTTPLSHGNGCSVFYSYTPESTGVVRKNIMMSYTDSRGNKKFIEFPMTFYVSTSKYEKRYNTAYLKDLSQKEIEQLVLSNGEPQGAGSEKETTIRLFDSGRKAAINKKNEALGSLFDKNGKLLFDKLKGLKTTWAGADVKEGTIDKIILEGEQEYQDQLDRDFSIGKTPRQYVKSASSGGFSLGLAEHLEKEAVDAAVTAIVEKTEDLNTRIEAVKKKVQDHDYVDVSGSLEALMAEIGTLDSNNEKIEIVGAKKALSIQEKSVFADQLVKVQALTDDFNALIDENKKLAMVQNFKDIDKAVRDEAISHDAVANAYDKTLPNLKSNLKEQLSKAAEAMQKQGIIKNKDAYVDEANYEEAISGENRSKFIADMKYVKQMIAEVRLYNNWLELIIDAREKVKKDAIAGKAVNFNADGKSFSEARSAKEVIINTIDNQYNAAVANHKSAYGDSQLALIASLDTRNVVKDESTAIDAVDSKIGSFNDEIDAIKTRIKGHDYDASQDGSIKSVSDSLQALKSRIASADDDGKDEIICGYKKTLKLAGEGFDKLFTPQLEEVNDLINKFGQLVPGKLADLQVVKGYDVMQEAVHQAIYGDDEDAKDQAVTTAKDTTLPGLKESLGQVSDNAVAAMNYLGILRSRDKTSEADGYKQDIPDVSKSAFITDMRSIEKMAEELELYGKYLESISNARSRVHNEVIPLVKENKFDVAHAKKNEIIEDINQKYADQVGGFEKKYLNAPYGSQAIVKTASLDAAAVIKQASDATDKLKSTVGKLNTEIDSLEAKIKAHDYEGVSADLQNLQDRIDALESSGLDTEKSSLKLKGANNGLDYLFLEAQKERVEVLITHYGNLEKIATAASGAFGERLAKMKQDNADIEQVKLLEADLTSALANAQKSMKELAIASNEKFSGDISSINELIGAVKGYAEKLKAINDSNQKVKDVLSNFTGVESLGMLRTNLTAIAAGQKSYYEEKRTELIATYKTPEDSFDAVNFMQLVTKQTTAIDEINKKIAELDGKITFETQKVFDHDYNDSEKFLNDLNKLKDEITKLENTDGEIQGYKQSLNLIKSNGGSDHNLFDSQLRKSDDLIKGFTNLKGIADAAREVHTREFKKIIKSKDSVDSKKNQISRLKEGMNNALTSVIGTLNNPCLGIIRSVDDNGEVTFGDAVDDTSKVKFKADISSLRQLIGELEGYEARIAVIIDTRKKKDEAVETFVKDSDFGTLKKSLESAVNKNANAYVNAQGEITKKYGTLSASFISVDLTSIVKEKVESVDAVIKEIEKTKNNIEEIAVRIKKHAFDANDSEKSVSECLNELNLEIQQQLKGKVVLCVEKSLGIKNSTPHVDIIINPLNERVEELEDIFTKLQGINSNAVANFRVELQSIRNSITRDSANAKNAVASLLEKLNLANTSAENAKASLEKDSSTMVANVAFNNDAFAKDFTAFKELINNEANVLSQKIDNYMTNSADFVTNTDAYKFVSAKTSYDKMVECLNSEIPNLKVGSSGIEASPLKEKMDGVENILSKLKALKNSNSKGEVLKEEKVLIYSEFKKLGYCEDGTIWGVTCRGSDKANKVEFVDDLLEKDNY